MTHLVWNTSQKPGTKIQAAVKHVLIYAVLTILTLTILFPFLWLLACTIRPLSDVYVTPPRWIPPHFSLHGYAVTLKALAMPMANAAFYGVCTAVTSLVVAAPAAYSLARFRYPGRRVVTTILLITQMLPFVLLLLPIYITYIKLGLYNTRIGLIIGFTALTVPFSILLLRSYFETLPLDLEDAAMIDGCTRMGAFLRVVMPLSAPVVMSVVLNNMAMIWNDVLFVIFLTKDTGLMTASVRLYHMFTIQHAATDQEVVLAGSVVITLPMVFLFIFLQKYIVKGMTVGAVRG